MSETAEGFELDTGEENPALIVWPPLSIIRVRSGGGGPSLVLLRGGAIGGVCGKEWTGPSAEVAKLFNISVIFELIAKRYDTVNVDTLSFVEEGCQGWETR